MTTRKKATAEITPAMQKAINLAAERAARRLHKSLTKELLIALGINAATPDAMQEAQKDAAWTRRVRRSSESVPAKLGVAGITALFGLIGTLIAFAVKKFMNW